MKKLAVISTHPIQYNAPFFRMLHERRTIEIKVFYTWSQSASGIKYDPGFKQNISWDIPLLEGYPFSFSENISSAPGSHHHKGIDNPGLIDEISKWNADAVMVYGWNFKSHLAAMRFFSGKIPVLFRGDSTLLDERPGIRKFMRRLYLRYIFRTVDIALYAGQANKAYFKAHGLKEKQMIFMPHAVDNRRFSTAVTAGEMFREKLSIPSDAPVFLFAGKLEEKKQPDMLLKAFIALRDRDAHLVIAGSGALQEALTALSAGNLYVHFTGFINQQDMPALYSTCDVFVLPSKGPGETWGLSINEAMAAGKAVIAATACGAAYDLIRQGINGFVFNKNDMDSLGQQLLFCMENISAVKKMGEESRKIINTYSFEEQATAVEYAVSPATGKE